MITYCILGGILSIPIGYLLVQFSKWKTKSDIEKLKKDIVSSYSYIGGEYDIKDLVKAIDEWENEKKL